ncbi:MAG TPA: CpsB/CapC family capsule biosynthesis tyrosine phosphatase [Chloroflexia bacterium]|jgi:protein-tyrosine phosphatase
MIDIHTHIIPDLDDGPPDIETSVGMGLVAAREGITAIISTSHNEEASAVGYEGMQARLEAVREAWVGAGLDIRLELGLEIYLRPDTVAELKAGRVWPLAGSQYVLVELPYQPWPAYAESALFGLQVAGYVPILAHPERYTALQTDPNRMYALAERGVLAQVTAQALIGSHGNAARRCAETLVRHKLAQFLSSDAHGLSERKRAPVLRQGLRVAEGLIGAEAANTMVEENPRYILERKLLTPEPERVSAPRWSFGKLLGRG